jgi:MFS transporter, DHA1 family, tetracycline resistance protein
MTGALRRLPRAVRVANLSRPAVSLSGLVECRVESRKPAVSFIFLTLLMDVMGFGLLIPVAPKLIQSIIHGSEADAAIPFGRLTATYAVMQFIFAPILGALSDRVGRRPVLLVSIFGSGLDYIAMALSPSLAFLFVTRALNGISGASMSVATAYIADITPPEKRAGAFGMVGAAFGLGFILGPALGGALGSIDIHYPFYAASGLAFANWLYGYFVLPESLPPDRRSKFLLSKANPIGSIRNLGKYPLVAWMAASLFLMNVAQFALHSTWALYTEHRYKWSPLDIGLSLMVVGLGAAFVQAGLARKIIPALGERTSLLLGIAIGVLAFIGYGSATHGWMIYAIVGVASLGGIAQPAGQSLITRSVLPTEQGAIQGSLSGLSSLAQIFGPLIGTNMFAYSISHERTFQVPGASFYVSAALTLVGLGVAAWATRGVGGRMVQLSQTPVVTPPPAGDVQPNP